MVLPFPLSAQQFGGACRVEVGMTYPFTTVGKWTFGDGDGRGVCTAFLANNYTLVTADGGKLLGADVSAPHPRRRRIHPAEQREGRAEVHRPVYPYLVDYVKEHPCEALR